MLFLRVKISCFRAKAHLAFHWCLYNKNKCFGLPYLTLQKNRKTTWEEIGKQVNNKWLFYYKKVTAQTPCFPQTLNLNEIPKWADAAISSDWVSPIFANITKIMRRVLEVTQDCQTITNDGSMTRQQVLSSLIFYVVLKTSISFSRRLKILNLFCDPLAFCSSYVLRILK